ncbi:MAG: radical SAM protein [Pirellulales bacterium]|nr:radical SAM protein [Pirellulales bacterium]
MVHFRQTIQILRMLADPRIARVPFRILRQIGPRGGRQRESGTWRERFRAVAFLWRWLADQRLTRHRGQWVIHSFLPPFPGRGFDRTFENLLPGGPRRLHSAFLALTDQCPADCSYCSMKNRRPAPPLNREEWLGVIEQVHGLGASLIGLTGGEPLLRPDLPELVRAAHEGGAEVVLFTSGLGATPERIDQLCDAGLWAMGVSLDRTSAEAVDRACRVPGAFDAALAALAASRRSGLYTFISAVADRDLVASGEHRRLHELGRRLGIHELRLTEAMPCGGLAVDGQDRLLTPEQVAELRQFHRATNRRGRGPKVCASCEVESPEFIGCVAGAFHLYVDPAGEACPCDFTPLGFGNVRQEPLDAIWRRMTQAMGGPRRGCFIHEQAATIRRHADGRGYPLPREVSCHVAAQAPRTPLPDYFECVTRQFLDGR